MTKVQGPAAAGKGKNVLRRGRPMVAMERLPAHGALLRRARLRLEMTLQAVADLARVGVYTVANAERGRATEAAFRSISLCLGLDPEAVLRLRLRVKGENLRFTPEHFPMRRSRP